MKTREPAVAGTFYPGTQERLNELISKIDSSERIKFDRTLKDIKIIGGVVPHAGYVYSGYEAVHFFNQLSVHTQPIDTVIILNPNHRGFGPSCAADIHDTWKTPVGEFAVDTDMAKKLNLPENELAHRFEHSAEVMLPLLKYYLHEEVKILPISIMRQAPDLAIALAHSIWETVKKSGKKILIIASSDFCHFVSPDVGFSLDVEVIYAILKLDVDAVYRTIKAKNISVCGYGPIMTLMEYAVISCDNVKVKVLARGNSAKSREMDQVVDYVTILFYTDSK